MLERGLYEAAGASVAGSQEKQIAFLHGLVEVGEISLAIQYRELFELPHIEICSLEEEAKVIEALSQTQLRFPFPDSSINFVQQDEALEVVFDEIRRLKI